MLVTFSTTSNRAAVLVPYAPPAKTGSSTAGLLAISPGAAREPSWLLGCITCVPGNDPARQLARTFKSKRAGKALVKGPIHLPDGLFLWADMVFYLVARYRLKT